MSLMDGNESYGIDNVSHEELARLREERIGIQVREAQALAQRDSLLAALRNIAQEQGTRAAVVAEDAIAKVEGDMP